MKTSLTLRGVESLLRSDLLGECRSAVVDPTRFVHRIDELSLIVRLLHRHERLRCERRRGRSLGRTTNLCASMTDFERATHLWKRTTTETIGVLACIDRCVDAVDQSRDLLVGEVKTVIRAGADIRNVTRARLERLDVLVLRRSQLILQDDATGTCFGRRGTNSSAALYDGR